MNYTVDKGLIQLPASGPGFIRMTSREYMTYGHSSLIAALQEACDEAVRVIAGRTAQSISDPRLAVVVKDLNTADGKASKGHKTHGKGGKNVDIGYFYRNGHGAIENRFINHKDLPYRVVSGARELKHVHPDWDLEANWLMTLALLRQPKVSQIMVDKLYAVQLEQRAGQHFVGDPGGLARALKVIQWYGNHDNHFHLTVEP